MIKALLFSYLQFSSFQKHINKDIYLQINREIFWTKIVQLAKLTKLRQQKHIKPAKHKQIPSQTLNQKTPNYKYLSNTNPKITPYNPTPLKNCNFLAIKHKPLKLKLTP
jgi:hypothetical protein